MLLHLIRDPADIRARRRGDFTRIFPTSPFFWEMVFVVGCAAKGACWDLLLCTRENTECRIPSQSPNPTANGFSSSSSYPERGRDP